MSTEPKEVLRRYCEATECRVWLAIKHLGNTVNAGSMRQWCSEECGAYQYNRWIYLTNLSVVQKAGKERYDTSEDKGRSEG